MHFPAVKKTFWQLLGPSVLFAALSLNGGEMLLWPELIAKYGLLIIWIVPLILYLQYSVNMEIERYTLVTGKNTLTALASTAPFMGWIIIVGIVISLLWPAWISTAGAMTAYLVGFSGPTPILSLTLLISLLLLWSNRNSYKILELGAKIGMVSVLSISIFVVVYLLAVVRKDIDLRPAFVPESTDAFGYVAALAFGGVTGVLNLVQSDWIASRKYGANAVNDPSSIDFTSAKSIQNWQQWWKLVNKEHFLLFFGGNCLGISLIGVVAAMTLTGFQGQGFELLTYQVDYLNNLARGLGIAWGVGILLLFLMAQVTILDAAGKLLKRSELPLLSQFKADRLSQYVGLLGCMIILLSLVIPGFSQPAFLLKLSAVLSAAIMAIYPILLVRINIKLPAIAKPSIRAVVSTVSCSIFYGGVVTWMLLSWL